MLKDKYNLSTLSVPMDNNILKIIDNHMEHMLNKHNKVYVMRIDIHARDNHELSKINQRLLQWEKRNGIDAEYVAVAEKDSKGNNHYHEFVMLDGNKTQSIHNHIVKTNEIVNNLRGYPAGTNTGAIHDCNTPSNPQPNGIMLHRNQLDITKDLQNAYRQASYLAKTEQKEGFSSRTRTVFASEIYSGRKKSHTVKKQ